jgi:hypothetical protein
MSGGRARPTIYRIPSGRERAFTAEALRRRENKKAAACFADLGPSPCSARRGSREHRGGRCRRQSGREGVIAAGTAPTGRIAYNPPRSLRRLRSSCDPQPAPREVCNPRPSRRWHRADWAGRVRSAAGIAPNAQFAGDAPRSLRQMGSPRAPRRGVCAECAVRATIRRGHCARLAICSTTRRGALHQTHSSRDDPPRALREVCRSRPPRCGRLRRGLLHRIGPFAH